MIVPQFVPSYVPFLSPCCPPFASRRPDARCITGGADERPEFAGLPARADESGREGASAEKRKTEILAESLRFGFIGIVLKTLLPKYVSPLRMVF